MEEEANMFASALLLPASDIRTYFIGRRIDLSLLGALKPEWRVSMQALLMSASEIVPLSANQKQYLWKQMSARGYRLREPPELDFERELPTVISDIIKVHERGLGYSREELSHVLHINLHEFSYYYPSINEDSRKPRLTIMR
jgi:Zn-dependent peptidase ImmA (M78 family)